ncbi:hypothetical protein AL036_12940 [Salipiger aestuarii]|uniref:hypothetical protein n=1 Tax=Salipiger aestuarii TaxID=568098 RepID=UPI000DBA4115|nr:hypothetical protein [Salipiger aestuarii]KAA8606846.1 hypothetical protein AL036_12940 [Salipiger aestuarii]KAB2540608.1 hypothetical protein AL035_16660 [Salipiger aestuarii]
MARSFSYARLYAGGQQPHEYEDRAVAARLKTVAIVRHLKTVLTWHFNNKYQYLTTSPDISNTVLPTSKTRLPTSFFRPVLGGLRRAGKEKGRPAGDPNVD